MSGSESMLVKSWEQVCVDSGKLESLHYLCCRQSSEIGRYEVPREESLPGLGITIDDFQINGIRHDVTESLKSAVRYSIALGPRFFRWKILSL